MLSCGITSCPANNFMEEPLIEKEHPVTTLVKRALRTCPSWDTYSTSQAPSVLCLYCLLESNELLEKKRLLRSFKGSNANFAKISDWGVCKMRYALVNL